MKSHSQPRGRRVLAAVAITMLLMLICAFPSPRLGQSVRAQIGTCPEGGSVIPGTACESGYVPCPSGAIVGAGSACPLGSTGTCLPTSCPLGGASCPAGASSLVAAGPGRCAAPTTPNCPGGSMAVGGVCVPTTKTCPNGVVVGLSQSCPNPNTPNCPPGVQPAVNSPCPNAPQNTVCPDGSVVPPGASCSPSTTPISTPPPSGMSVTYNAGWNIVAGPAGTMLSGTLGPLYTLQTGDTTYETIQPGTPLKAGAGYLAYFPAAGQSTMPLASPGSTSVQLAPGQFILIGNPGNTRATVAGADTLLAIDPSSGALVPATSLAPGQGAWCMSNVGGQVIITNAPS